MDPLQIESITFSNFKALVNTTLPLGRFTLIVGPNGSGKSTALQGIRFLSRGESVNQETGWLRSVISVSGSENDGWPKLVAKWGGLAQAGRTWLLWRPEHACRIEHRSVQGQVDASRRDSFLHGMRVYALDPVVIPTPVPFVHQAELHPNGHGLAVVIHRIWDEAPERFEALNGELRQWLPEFDRILFETTPNGNRGVRLRTATGGHSIAASEVSQGTMLALTMLTLAYLPQPPSLIGLEEPDRGIHPRLLRDVRDALYRLAYPESFGETRPPVQVIATTQSPYFLDLFREHPEEVVIAEKKGLDAEFVPLSSHPHIEEILEDGSLGDIWYSGILGGVPSGT